MPIEMRMESGGLHAHFDRRQVIRSRAPSGPHKPPTRKRSKKSALMASVWGTLDTPYKKTTTTLRGKSTGAVLDPSGGPSAPGRRFNGERGAPLRYAPTPHSPQGRLYGFATQKGCLIATDESIDDLMVMNFQRAYARDVYDSAYSEVAFDSITEMSFMTSLETITSDTTETVEYTYNMRSSGLCRWFR